MGYFWFTGPNTMCFVVKDTTFTLQKVIDTMASLRTAIGDKPVGLLVEATSVKPLSLDMINIISRESKYIFRAIAFISKSRLAMLVVNTFLHFGNLPFPAKVFTVDEAAQVWLNQVMENNQE